jgi:general secretion pathway protein D
LSSSPGGVRAGGRARKGIASTWIGRTAAFLAVGLALWTGYAEAAERAASVGPTDKLELVEFRDVALGDALRLLSRQSGLQVVPSAEAAKVNVSLYLRDVEPLAALESLCNAHGLWFRQHPETGITLVRTIREYERDLETFRDERTQVFTLLYPNALDVAVAIRDLFGERVELSFGADEAEVFDELRERLDRFDLFDQRSQGLGLFEGGLGGTELASSLNRYTDEPTTRVVRRRDDLLARSRRSSARRSESSREELTAEQIQAIEAAIQRADELPPALAERFSRGRASIFVTVIRRHNKIIVRTSDQQTMAQVRELIEKLDVPTSLVLLEVKVMTVDLGDQFDSVFDFQFKEGDFSGGFTTGDIQGPATPGSLSLGGTGLNTGNLIFQFVGDNLRARMQLLEQEGRVTTMATPMLLTANNEVSRIFVGEERPLNRSFTGPQTLVGDDVQTTTPGSTAIEFRPVGTTLLVTPNINADRTVTLRLLQETSAVSPDPAPVLVPTDTGFEEQEVDVVQTRTVSGTIVAKDGLAVAIGGLIEETVRDDRKQVPILGKIPIIGFFFRRQESDRLRQELVIMIRPHVLSTPTESEEVSRRLVRELSLHPNVPDARGTMEAFEPEEVSRAKPREHELRNLFEFHSLEWGEEP